MSCSPFDLRDYLLGELSAGDRRLVEKHVGVCGNCREELARLEVTHSALRALAEEEIPRGIAFVSDKVFEPSPWRRAWQSFWNSSARLGFVSAAVLSVALVVTALNRPVPAPAVSTPVSQVEMARLEKEFNQRMDAAVQKAVALSEARQDQKTAALLQAAEKRYTFDKEAYRLFVSQNIDVLQKQLHRATIAANDMAAERQGAAQ
jgi:anti-sigma factor RsiW